MSGCAYSTWDGAYVLGSLSTSDRREFESHLTECADCSRAVRDLAGMPGLLGRLGPEVLDEGEPEPVPETLLPRLVEAMHRGQRRRTWLTAGLAAAAAVVVTAGGVLLLDPGSESGSPQASPSSSVATAPPMQMRSVSTDPMTASVSMTTVPWGTRIDMTCTYPHQLGEYVGGSYALVVHLVGGHAERVATWNGLPGKSMQLTAATAAPRAAIRSIDVTRLDGEPLLHLSL